MRFNAYVKRGLQSGIATPELQTINLSEICIFAPG